MITPTLLTTDHWILLTHPLGPANPITPPFPSGAWRILQTKGNASSEKRWWKTGTDELAFHYLVTEVWVSLDSRTSSEQVLDLEELLNSELLKDLSDMRSDGVKDAHWPGTESRLIGIPHFPGII